MTYSARAKGQDFIYGTTYHAPDVMLKGGATYRVVTDHLGSVRLVVDVATGAVAQRLDYDEWGRVLLDTNPGFQPFGYAGGLYDPATGLVRFGARDYDAEVGRWTAKDPIRFAGGDENIYAYARSNPHHLLDATGRYPSAAARIIQHLLWKAPGQIGKRTGKSMGDQGIGAGGENDSDGNGVPDFLDDWDNDGIPNYADDSDGDGIPDSVDEDLDSPAMSFDGPGPGDMCAP